MELQAESPGRRCQLDLFADPTDEALAQGDRGCAGSPADHSRHLLYPSSRLTASSVSRTRGTTLAAPTLRGPTYGSTSRQTRGYTCYVRLIEVPSTMLACLSFAAFFLRPSVGERIGFGSTMILAQFVLMTVAGDKLPTCGELLWIDVLLCLNMIFTFVALLESCYVTYISTMPPTLMECAG